MVTLQLSLPSCVNQKGKSPIVGLLQNHHQPPPKLPSTLLPGLSMTSSHQPEHPVMLFPPANQSVAAIVFGDGSDARLYPLTKRRSEGAIPIAAKYRLIDAVVSNCINSNINKIYALTQFNSTSLNSHLTRAYSGVGLGKEGFVEVIAAYQSQPMSSPPTMIACLEHSVHETETRAKLFLHREESFAVAVRKVTSRPSPPDAKPFNAVEKIKTSFTHVKTEKF